jgi:hypothetical protein
VEDAMKNIMQTFDGLREQYKVYQQPMSLLVLASQMLFAKCGSNKGTSDYEGRQRVQVQFVAPQLLNRVEEVKVHNSSPQLRNEEAKGHVTLPKPAAKMTLEEQYALSMRQIAESQAHGAAQKGPCA